MLRIAPLKPAVKALPPVKLKPALGRTALSRKLRAQGQGIAQTDQKGDRP